MKLYNKCRGVVSGLFGEYEVPLCPFTSVSNITSFFLGGGSFIIFDIIYGINDTILDDFELLM